MNEPWPTPAAEDKTQSDGILSNGERNLYGQDPEVLRVGASPRGWDDDKLGGEADWR